MPAAAAKAKTKSPVGADPRPEFSEGGKVKNAPADVMVVQRLLAASGHKTEVNGRVNGALVKAISVFQKANGFKRPDGVVDPGGRTFKALVKRASAGKEPSVEIEVYQVVIRGKQHMLSEKDFNKAVAEVCKKLGRVQAAMASQYDTVHNTARFYIDAATGASGFMDALVMWTSSLRAGLEPPGFSHGASAWVMLKRVEKAIGAKDVRKALAAMPAAQKELNAYAKEVMDYGNKFAGGAKKMQENLELVRDTSFEIASGIAAAYLVARGKASPVQAKAAAGAVFGMIKSASTQYGRSLAGYNDSAMQSAMVVMIDGVSGGVKGGLNQKVVGGIGKNLAKKLVGEPPFNFVGQTVAQKFFNNWVSGAGKQAVTEVFEGVLAMMTDIAKSVGVKGKSYNFGKEFEKKVVDGLYKTMTGGVLGNLGSATDKVGTSLSKGAVRAARDTSFLKKLRLDKNDWFQGLTGAKQIEHMTDVVNSLAGNLGNDVLKTAWGGTIDKLKGSESPQAIADAVAQDVMRHKSFLKAMEKRFAALEKKHAKKK